MNAAPESPWRVTRRLPCAACGRPDGLDATHAGVESLARHGDSLEVTYDLRETNLDALLEALDFDPGRTGLAARLLLRLERHRERLRAEELKYIGGWDNIVREIYVTHYRHRAHGRRDDRRRQWRQYEQQRAASPDDDAATARDPAAPEETTDG